MRRIPRFVWGILAACAVLACLAAVEWKTGRPRQLEPIRFEVSPPSGVSFRPFPTTGRVLVSTDGRKLAAVVEEGKSTRILIRPLESLSSSLLPAPYRLVLLAWSPDSRSIAFYSDGKLWRMDASGGSPLEIGEAQNVRSAAWGAPADNSSMQTAGLEDCFRSP